VSTHMYTLVSWVVSREGDDLTVAAVGMDNIEELVTPLLALCVCACVYAYVCVRVRGYEKQRARETSWHVRV